ncbi:MAG: shikimate dehydrogenase [Acidimicrobiia bacterium]
MKRPSGATQVAAVIGHPVRHSLSPVLHNAAFEACDLDWVYVALDVEPGAAPAALTGVRALGIRGLNVTMPHKTDVAHAVDRLTPEAQALDAVNCVTNHDGDLIGHNTDGPGFVDSLRAEGIDVHAMACVVLGAGGAARAVVRSLADAGAREVVVVNRTAGKAAVAAALADGVGRVGSTADLAGADLIVNATSVGMGDPATSAALPLEPHVLRAGQVVADLVYHPLETGLLVAARQAGATPVGGLGMLVHQAGRAFSLWTGVAAPIDTMMDAALAHLAR